MKSECDLQQAESDLQSAVARLAAIRSAVQGRDLRHLRLQDLQVTLAALPALPCTEDLIPGRRPLGFFSYTFQLILYH